MNGIISLVVGAVCLGIGVLGRSGRMDHSRVALYRRPAGSPPPTPQGQRLGGATFLVAGVVFLVIGVVLLLR